MSTAVNTNPERYDPRAIRLRLQSQLPLSLKYYDCHFNWISVKSDLTENEIGIAILNLEKQFKEVDDKEKERMLKDSTIKVISKKLTLAFFNIESRKFNNATKYLEEAKKLVETALENNFIHEEYTQGFYYLFNGLEMYSKLENGAKLSELNSREFVSFKKVPAKGKAVVWITRDYFLEDCAMSKIERCDFIEKIVQIEPTVIRWHYYIYAALFDNRKLKPRPQPYGQETIIPDNPLSFSNYSRNLTELFVRPRVIHSKRGTMRLGKMRFPTKEDIVETININCEKVFCMDCDNEDIFMKFAEIYMYLLPEEYKDLDMAYRCMRRALELNRESIQVHHRMAILQIKLRNLHEAHLHLNRVVIRGKPCIGALIGHLQILMAYRENRQEILKLFHRYLNTPTYIKSLGSCNTRLLYYLKGCFHFMQEDINEDNHAIDSWINAHDNTLGSFYFLNLPRQANVFGWSTKKLNLTNVSNTLKHFAYLEKTQDRIVLLDICLQVDDAIRRNSE